MDFEDIPAGGEEEVMVDAPPPVPDQAPDINPPPSELDYPQEEDVYESTADNVLPEPESEPQSFLPDPEPAVDDALTIFNREWNAKLEEKRAAEFEAMKQVRETAQNELDGWNQQRDLRLVAKKESNRTEEQVKVEQLTSEAEALKTWDRVSKLIDAGEGSDAKGSDVSRMRKLFIQLKNEPLETTRAAAAD